MAENPNTPRVRINNAGEMTQIIPYLVGFTPEESLVIVVVDRGKVAVTARVDIGDVQPPGEAEHLLDRMWARFPDAHASLVAYTTDQRAGWALLERCADHLPGGVAQQGMIVDADTWHLADGASGPVDRFGPVAAEVSFQGLQRLSSRSQLVVTLASPPDSDELTARVAAALDRLPHPGQTDAIVACTKELLRRNLPAPDAGDSGGRDGHIKVDVEDAIQLAVLIQNPEARQVAVLAITGNNARDHLTLWRTAVNNVPEYGAEAPLFLAGMAAWASGEGAIASIALERSAQVGRPGAYPPAQLLDRLIEHVVPPTAWDELRAGVLADANSLVREAVIGSPAATVWESVRPQDLREPRPHSSNIAPPTPGIAI